MCYQKMCQMGGRKAGRQLPVPVVSGIGQNDMCARKCSLRPCARGRTP